MPIKGIISGCIVKYYPRKNPKGHCFHIYQEDCVKGVMKLDKTKKVKKLRRDPQQPMFQNVIFYEPRAKTLRIHARGAKNCEALARLFFKHCFGLDEIPDYDTEVYNLSIMYNPEFDFPTDDRIESVFIKEVICDLGNNEIVTIKNNKRGAFGIDLHKKFTSWGLDIFSVEFIRVKICVLFKKQEGVRQKTRTRYIAVPNDTDLSNDYYDQIIREHVDGLWNLKLNLLVNEEAAYERPCGRLRREGSARTDAFADRMGWRW